MVLEPCEAKNRDELETPSSPSERDKDGFVEMSRSRGERCGAHHFRHHWTELLYHGEKAVQQRGRARDPLLKENGSY